MSPAAKSIFLFGFYLLAMGIGLFLVPNLMLGLLGIPSSTEIWIRVVGLFAIVLSSYFLYMSRKEQVEFFKISIVARILFFTGCLILALFWSAPWMLVTIAAIDILGLFWTLWGLKQG